MSLNVNQKILVGIFSYYNTDLLGSGSFSTVYKGINTGNGQSVAIKEITLNNNVKLIECMKSEIKTMKLLNHINIVNLIEFYRFFDRAYIIMEYCEGGNLLDYINSTQMNEILVHDIAIQIRDAIHYIHNNGIIHRDLKPHNILITYNNDTRGQSPPTRHPLIKVCDFGFAKISEINETMCGSPLYMSPEVLRGQKYTNSSDLWSFGIIMYQMITGDVPFNSGTIIELHNAYKNLSQISITPNSVSDQCKNLIESLLVIDQHTRIDTSTMYRHPWWKTSGVSEPNDDIDQFVVINKLSEGTCPSININKNNATIELKKWLVVMRTLEDIGKQKMEMKHIREAQVFFEKCHDLGNFLLKTSQKSQGEPVVNLLISQINTQIDCCFTKMIECNKQKNNFEKLQKTPDRILYDMALSLEKRGYMEIELGNKNKAIEYLSSGINIFDYLYQFSDDDTQKHEIITYLSRMRRWRSPP